MLPNRIASRRSRGAHHDRSGGLSGDTRCRLLAEQWHTSIERQVAQGTRSPNTAQLYRLTLDTHVLPALGELRLREMTVPRLDVAVQAIQASKGTASAKLARTVISGALGRPSGTGPSRSTRRATSPAPSGAPRRHLAL